MIAGFNTDIEYNGTVYHVQTEDKGARARQIMSLVYDKGTILASKRVNYEELGALDLDEKELAERVSRQHKLICAAVKAGRIDELKEMSGSSRAAPPQTNEPLADNTTAPAPVSAPLVGSALAAADPFADAPILEPIAVIDELVLPPEAVEVVSELSGQERPEHNKLTLELLDGTRFRGGDRKTLNILICRGTARKVVAGAQIMIKIIGSSFRPVIFHANSNANGLARVHVQVPHFQSGRAALLIRATNEGEQIELRRIVTAG